MIYSIVKYILIPSNIIIILFFLGIILFFTFKRFKNIGRIFLIVSACFYVFFGTGPVSFWLLGKLEYQYPYLKNADLVQDVAYIVVLSGYADNDINIPLSSRVNSSCAFRLMEALKLQKEIPGTKIIISGSERISGVMKEVVISLGVDQRTVITENHSFSTFENAKNISKIIGNQRFILVTSAGHMPRSMMVFKKAGMDPIPAPTDYLTFKNYMAISYLPSPLHLMNSDLAVHEYIGILWYRLTGRI